MKVVYAVAYVEIEYGWGDRSEGYALYLDKEECIKQTKKASKNGNYEGGGGYYGPVRPLSYCEVPYSSLTAGQKRDLKEHGACHTENHWSPKFSGGEVYI